VFDAEDPGPEYTLAWPRRLFTREASALLRAQSSWSISSGELLLEEAFVGDVPRDGLRTASWADLPAGPGNPWNDAATAQRWLVQQLLLADYKLPLQRERSPYYAARHNRLPASGSTAPRKRASQLRRDRAALVGRLLDTGYLDRAAPRSCVDSPEQPQHEVLDAATEDLLGTAGLWPLRPDKWDDDTFYSLVEAVHDLVARPRDRSWHDYSHGGWHYSNFAIKLGQFLYRWQVNRLLARLDPGLELASDGEDTGRLVHTNNNDRRKLVDRALGTSTAGRDDIGHAVALWRGRTANDQNKRSAIFSLARMLESHRTLLKRELLSKDENALFEIANRYDLRHRNASQRVDYDPVFLDWVFWWYLATVELADRLLARQAAT